MDSDAIERRLDRLVLDRRTTQPSADRVYTAPGIVLFKRDNPFQENADYFGMTLMPGSGKPHAQAF